MQLSHYTYRVTWLEEDQEFVGLCSEFPSLSWLDEDQDEAFKGIRQLINEVVADMMAERCMGAEKMTYKGIMRKYHGTVYPEDTQEVHYEQCGEIDRVFSIDDGSTKPFFPPDDGLTGKQRNEIYRAKLKKKRGY